MTQNLGATAPRPAGSRHWESKMLDLKELAEQWAADNNKSDTLNSNIGSDGTNVIYHKAQGNRGKQMNPNWHSNNLKVAGASDEDEPDDDDCGEIYGPVGGLIELGKSSHEPRSSDRNGSRQ